jgi:starch-binding outer membrane protein, SusD/RagB family
MLIYKHPQISLIMKQAHISKTTTFMRKRILIFLTSLAIFASCVDLDLLPEDSYGANVLQDPQSAGMVINAAYSYLTDYAYYGRAFIYLNDIVSDDSDYVPGHSIFPHRVELDSFTYNPSHTKFSELYPRAYRSIAVCNRIIDNWVPGHDPYVKGQALFLRSLNYFNLVRLFGGVPLITTMEVPVDYFFNIERATIDDVYALIFSDLATLINEDLLPANWSGANAGRADLWAAHTLLSKAYLTAASEGTLHTGDKSSFYQKAAMHAKTVMDQSDRRLEPDYKTIWLRGNLYTNSEVIFAIGANGVDVTDGGVPGRYYRSYEPLDPGFNEGWGNNIPQVDLYNSFDDNDYRKEVGFLTHFVARDTLVRTTGTFYPGDTVTYHHWIPSHIRRPHLRKFYYDPGPVHNYSANIDGIHFMVLRFADVLLMYAEAENEINGPNNEAIEAINMIRRRAFREDINTPGSNDLPAGLSQTQFRQLIRTERRKELHHEAQRWFDLVRWNIYVQTMMAAGKTNVQEHHRYFPLPQVEIDRNPNLKQNDGY